MNSVSGRHACSQESTSHLARCRPAWSQAPDGDTQESPDRSGSGGRGASLEMVPAQLLRLIHHHDESVYVASAAGETPAMENEKPGPIHLYRIDPSQNMRRSDALAIQPTLFGGASVVRNWGRIGTNGQSMIETFDSDEDAVSASRRFERMKRRRGYRDCGPT